MRKNLLTIGVILAICSASAFAGDVGFYIGADVGRSTIGGSGNLSQSTDTVFGVTAGYQFNRNWGLEAQYSQLGSYSGVGQTTGSIYSGKINSLSLSGVGMLPLTDSFSLYAKLGIANTNNEQSSSIAGNRTTSRTDATYGLGLQYAVTPAIGVRFGVDHFNADAVNTTTNTTRSRDVDVWSLGAVYKF